MFTKFLRLPHFFLAVILLGYLGFGLHHLSQFITADEHYWLYERIPQYWDALSEGKWKKTLINDKPGVSLALVSGFGLFYDRSPHTLCYESLERISVCNHNRSQEFLFFFRLPLLFFNLLILGYLFYILRKLGGERVALFSILFIGLSPILLGITQIVNPDALLWSTGAAAIFSYFALLKLRQKRYIFLSGFFLSLAILSKYTASFLLPFFLFLSVLSPFMNREGEDKNTFALLLKNNLLYFFGTFFFAFLLGILLLPAAWVEPLILLQLFWGGGAVSFPFSLLILPGIFVFDILFFRSRLTYTIKIFIERLHLLSLCERLLPLFIFVSFIGLALGRIFLPEWDLFEKVPFDLKDLYNTDKPDKFFLPNIFEAFILELNPFLFSLPLALLSPFLFFCLFQVFKKKSQASPDDFPAFSLFFFIVTFLITFIFSEVLATARYLILLYPIAAYLAALGLEKLSLIIALRVKETFRPVILWSFPTLALLASFVSLISISPYYFTYTSILLPKDKLIHHAWGYGGYEAAQYLNSLPNADKMIIWSDYHGVCEFFVGRCVTVEYAAARKLNNFDYVVLSARGKALYKPEHIRWQKPGNLYIAPLYNDDKPLWQIEIGDRPGNFIKVLPFKKNENRPS